MKERNYPVDYAFPRKITYSLKLHIPENYTITKLPENKAFSLPNKGGIFIFKSKKKENTVTIYVNMSIQKRIYRTEEYYALKEFYKQIIIAESSYITIEKKP